jgi:peroxiredoxin
MKANLFADKPIEYANIGYMECFNLIFEDYIAHGNKNMPPLVVERWIENQQYATMIDSLGMDSVLKNEVFRELVFLKGMRDAFLTKGTDRDGVIKMIDALIDKTKFEKHRTIALNLKTYLQSISNGMEIEDFVLTNADEQEIKMRSLLSEKPVILCFIKVKDVVCRRELETIHQLYNKMKDSVKIVVISFDPSLDALYNFVKNTKIGSRYEFDMLHFNLNWDMLEKFHIVGFPAFMLLSKDGKVVEPYLAKPSDMEGVVDANSDTYRSKWQRFMKTN